MRTFIMRALPNNGIHPTADTQLVKFLRSLVAAGDAGRNDAEVA
jgi:hypothetical protein